MVSSSSSLVPSFICIQEASPSRQTHRDSSPWLWAEVLSEVVWAIGHIFLQSVPFSPFLVGFIPKLQNRAVPPAFALLHSVSTSYVPPNGSPIRVPQVGNSCSDFLAFEGSRDQDYLQPNGNSQGYVRKLMPLKKTSYECRPISHFYCPCMRVSVLGEPPQLVPFWFVFKPSPRRAPPKNGPTPMSHAISLAPLTVPLAELQ